MTTYQNDIHTCHADCQNPACIAARKSVKAFSRQPIYYAETKTVDKQDGMDLRDYFAAKAMVSLIDIYAYDSTIETGDERRLAVALSAYKQADEMMKARGQ